MENLMNTLDIETQLRHTKIAVEELQNENKMLLNFIKLFVNDFEGDYVMADGRIVDNPPNLLLMNYKLAKNVIEKAQL